jgi:hypothetical protein
MFARRCVATSVPLFVSFEVVTIDALGWLGLLATVWLRAFIAVLRIEAVVYLAAELIAAVKPRARANENVPTKPLWTVVAGRSTVVRGDVIVSVGTVRSHADFDADLSLRPGSCCRKATAGHGSHHKKSKSTHKFTSVISVYVSSNMSS